MRNYAHLAQEDNCTAMESDPSMLACNQYISILSSIRFGNPYLNAVLSIKRVDTIFSQEGVTEGSSQNFPYRSTMAMVPMVSGRQYSISYSGPFPRPLNIYREWQHKHYPGSVSLRFPYSFTNLINFTVAKYTGGVGSTVNEVQLPADILPNSCTFGNFINSTDRNELGLCFGESSWAWGVSVKIFANLVPAPTPNPPNPNPNPNPNPVPPTPPAPCDMELPTNIT